MNIFFYLIYLHKEQEKREVPKIKNEEFKHKVKHNKSFERKIIAVEKISKKEAVKKWDF